MSTRDEQETSVAGYRHDYYTVFSADPVHIRRIRKDDRFTITSDTGDTIMATIPGSAYDPLKGIKRRSKPMTDEQRAKAAERLRVARSTREGS